MKLLATVLLAATACCAAPASYAQSLERTVRSVMPPPGVSNSAGNKTGANKPIRNQTDVYASVYADETGPGPWIDDTSVRGKKRQRSW